jgi:bifunctional DNA-binding transcriptional regulator/antitoxin component of YhaV-PrlF toxin-antitoxin module
MLTGTYIYRIDRKGRLVIPGPFRAALGEPVLLTSGPERSLRLLPRQDGRWLDPALVFEQPLDPTTGRILVPSALREWAGLRTQDEVAVCGRGLAAAVLRWEACLAALRTGGAVPWHLPELAALYVENAALRQRLAREEAERAVAVERALEAGRAAAEARA